MKNNDFTTSFQVDQSPEEVFKAICNVRGWWSEEVAGATEKLDDEFNYHYRDVHSCTMKLTEVIPDKRIIWHVLDNYFNFIKNQSEWKGTDIIFEISKIDDKTMLHFTHKGLVPEYECYQVCFDAWTGYLQNSLRDLIVSGKGTPNPKENHEMHK